MNKMLIILVCLLLSPTICLGFENEPAQFRGLKWGESVAGHRDFYLSDVDEIGRKVDFTETTPHAKLYRQKGDKRLIGKAEINDIFYKFYKDKLYYVRINYNTVTSYQLLYQTLLDLHGKPDYTDDQGYTRWKEWRGKDINITLSFAQLVFNGRIIKLTGFIDYTFIPLDKEYSSDLKSYSIEEDERMKANNEKLRKQRQEQSKKAAKDLY